MGFRPQIGQKPPVGSKLAGGFAFISSRRFFRRGRNRHLSQPYLLRA